MGMEPASRIGAVIPTVLKETRQQHGPLFAVQRGWKRLVGKELAAHTKPVSLRRGRLVIHADRPGDSFTLNYQRPHLMQKLHAVTCGRVEDIIIRAGEV